MLPYVALYEYIHKQVEHVMNQDESKQTIYDEYKNIVLSPQLTDKVFVEVMNNYFYDMGFINVSLKALKEEEKQVGFRVRATKNSLVVTEVIDDIRFVVGDEIKKLSGDVIDYCRKRYHRILGDTPYHREDWNHILTFQNSVNIERSNQEYHFDLRLFKQTNESSVSVYTKDDVPIVEFKGNITFSQAVEALYELSKIQSSNREMIFDLRNASFNKVNIAEFLLPYFYEIGSREKIDVSDMEIEIEREKHKMLYKKKLERYFKQSEEMNDQSFYQNLLDQPVGNWKFFDDKIIEIIGMSRFDCVTVMIDKDTEQAAEWLVDKVSPSKIVKTVGRPTKGNTTFNELVDEIIDQRFILTFPVENMKNIKYRDAIYPTELIEWSKRHAIIDLDIKFTIDNSC